MTLIGKLYIFIFTMDRVREVNFWQDLARLRSLDNVVCVYSDFFHNGHVTFHTNYIAKRQSSFRHRLTFRRLQHKYPECSRLHRGRQCSTWRCRLVSVESSSGTLLLYLHRGGGRKHIPPQCSGSFSFRIRHNDDNVVDPQMLSSQVVLW